MVLRLSKANKTGDENKPQQSLVFAKGKVGAIIGTAGSGARSTRRPAPSSTARSAPT